MQRVERTFLQQANVKLSEKPSQIFDVNVNDRDLGDPLIPERIIRPENRTLSHFILFTRTPTDAILVDFTILGFNVLGPRDIMTPDSPSSGVC
jgi:hypothetical protein